MGNDRSPELAELLRRASEALGLELRVSMQGRVVSFDAKTQKADVQPLVKQTYWDEAGARIAKSWPVIPGVPVQFPGGGGYRFTFPVKAGKDDGDLVTLLFSDQSLDRWLAGSGAEVDPEIDHSHAISDAVALLGTRPFGAGGPLQTFPTDAATWGKDGAGGPFISINESKVVVGGSSFVEMDVGKADDFVAMATATKKDLDALNDYVHDHVHPIKYKYTKCTGSGTDGGDFHLGGVSDTSTGDSDKTSTGKATIDPIASQDLKATKPA